MPRGSAPGERRGGRRRGTRNRRTIELRALAEAQPREGTPLEFLTSVYRNEALPIDRRIDAAGKAAPYVHPRLAAVTLGGDRENPVPVITRIELVPVKAKPRE
jgi:hypothetical protein